eukprot:15476921-Alexandrium_andersonii.AAC.1
MDGYMSTKMDGNERWMDTCPQRWMGYSPQRWMGRRCATTLQTRCRPTSQCSGQKPNATARPPTSFFAGP